MTRQRYLDMCQELGNEPIESEIPFDFEDFPPDVQDSIVIYGYLKDNWEYMGGNYIGKDLTNLFHLFDLFEIEQTSRKLVFQIIRHLDTIRQKLINNKKPSGGST